MRWVLVCLAIAGCHSSVLAADNAEHFRTQVQPVLERACVACHNDNDLKGGLSLSSEASMKKGGDSGAAVVPGNTGESLLVEFISGAKPAMPKKGAPLTPAEVAAIRSWIVAGAHWPPNVVLREKHLADTQWWSLQPLPEKLPAPPQVADASGWCRTPVDRFILAKLNEKGLSPSPEASPRVLARRLYFDLIGLPPTADELEQFERECAVSPTAANEAYLKLVDRLLASPHYGERWARHWLDVVHYGDTHGFDKDKIRPNAWPYRDYVVRSLNNDKPYARFIREQLAGDVLFPNDPEGIVALGFVAAGPFDWVGHVEVSAEKTDGQICRMLDRDDMVRTTMETFCSLTVGCARCHNHKFDPIPQEDYYSLQAVFAAVGRADRPYENDPANAERRRTLVKRETELQAELTSVRANILAAAGPELALLEKRLAELQQQKPGAAKPEFGYHSQLAPQSDVPKWVQVDLGASLPVAQIMFVACHDDFNGIGAGFGFPVRYKIELCDDPEFKAHVQTVVDRTNADEPNPGCAPQIVAAGKTGRYVRVTATKLALRQNDYMLALGELLALSATGENLALGKPVTSLDSIEAPVRWTRSNLVDGYYFGQGTAPPADVAKLAAQRDQLVEKSTDVATRTRLKEIETALKALQSERDSLPQPGTVYAIGTEFPAEGNHVPQRGAMPVISVLKRGEIKSPGAVVLPGTLSCVTQLPSRFEGEALTKEGARRVALANWIAEGRNPLTWRSIVNRTWQFHLGRGLVESSNDFGRMGREPSHPELLDWLAVWFRDEAQGSHKQLHRLIVTSRFYRQQSHAPADHPGLRIDAANQYLWRMHGRRLEAEAVRDAVLAASGKLDRTLGGPGYYAFGFKNDHSPHYLYEEYSPDDPKSHRRSIYRFIVRSVPDPFMETLDCADPSLLVERRNETLTALQALALLNNPFMLRMSEHCAARADAEVGPSADWPARVQAVFRAVLGRSASPTETELLSNLGRKHGLANVCRLLFNCNEFVFVD